MSGCASEGAGKTGPKRDHGAVRVRPFAQVDKDTNERSSGARRVNGLVGLAASVSPSSLLFSSMVLWRERRSSSPSLDSCSFHLFRERQRRRERVRGGRKEGRSDCGLGARSIEGGHRQLTQDVVVEACCVITNQRDLCSPSEDPSGAKAPKAQ